MALATALNPDKVIAFQDPGVLESESVIGTSDLSTEELEGLLEENRFSSKFRTALECLIACCHAGVPRCHVVSSDDDGALLQELFTPDGSGTQISEGLYRLIRRAVADDVGSIMDLLRPFEEDGSLIARNRDLLVASINNFFVAEIDDTIVGSVCLYELTEGVQEIGSLVAVPSQRNKRLGQELLSRAETEAKTLGAHTAFVKTTQTIDWIVENGYVSGYLEDLPKRVQQEFDNERNSKVLIKKLV